MHSAILSPCESETRSCAFLFKGLSGSKLSILETLDNDILEYAHAAEHFAETALAAASEALERGDRDKLVELLRQCAALGFFSCEVPEEFGGLDLPKIVAAMVGDRLCEPGGFGVAASAHAGIATLPLAFYGSEASKARYLPRLICAQMIGAYCLSEPDSGSDAQAARARAVPQPDGSYELSGTKAWITNAGIADLFTIFAKVPRPEGELLSAFLVERSWPGVGVAPEESKLGIKSSSTCQVILDHVRVPAENLLGQEGQGARIAFNILNIGRYKLGSSAAYNCRKSLRLAARYAAERKSFGQPLCAYGAIQEKLGRMAAHTYAAESVSYAVIGMIDEATQGASGTAEKLKAVEAFLIETSILKIMGSEALDLVVDETLQIHGGVGFTTDLAVERHYRDSRINRIFEGTNEINRLLMGSTLLKRIGAGEFGVHDTKRAWRASRMSFDSEPNVSPESVVEILRDLGLAVIAAAYHNLEPGIKRDQEVLLRCADVMIAALGSACATHRAARLARLGHRHAQAADALNRAYLPDAVANALLAARELAEVLPGLECFDSLPRWFAENRLGAIENRQRAAECVMNAGGYPL
jgi:alkylation response protein AidB-like acyl-CoA dehydrogenase